MSNNNWCVVVSLADGRQVYVGQDFNAAEAAQTPNTALFCAAGRAEALELAAVAARRYATHMGTAPHVKPPLSAYASSGGALPAEVGTKSDGDLRRSESARLSTSRS